MEQVTKLTQQQRILNLLKSGYWVALPDILELRIASHTRRIHELRKAGNNIEIIKDGRTKTWYRLVKHD